MRQIYEQKKKQHHYAFLKKNGVNYEIIINPSEALDFRKGKIFDVKDALEFEEIFSNAKAGEKASDLMDNFGTEDVYEIAKEIIMDGSFQLTSEYKKSLSEQKRKEAIDLISRNCTDSRTKSPIPVSRIELALEQIKFNFDPFKSAKEQLKEVSELLAPILPMNFDEKKIKITASAEHAGKMQGLLAKYGKVQKADWKSDGSCEYEIMIPGGLRDELIDKTNSLTRGSAIIDF